MNENTSKRKEWVKNAAIIFLAVMLVLTFFSNTIMNYSLPEVATQYVERGSITAKVRGTGKAEATDPYHVKIKESRVIGGVAVKQGDTVEKGDVLYYLEDEESEELQKAQAELADLELTYMKGLFGNNVSPEIISKVANGNVDSFGALQRKVTDMQNRMEAAQDRINECKKALEEVTLQSTINTNNAGVSTIPSELEKDKATTDLANAQTAFNNYKAQKVAELQSEIAELQAQIADLEILVVDGEPVIDSNHSSEELAALQKQMDTALAVVKKKVEEINSAISATTGDLLVIGDTITVLKQQYADLYKVIYNKTEYTTMIGEYNDALKEYDKAENNFKIAAEGFYDSKQSQLKRKKEELAGLQSQLLEVQAITAESNGSVAEAKDRLDQATRNITEITSANKQSAAAYQNKIANAEAALKNAQAVYDLLKEEQTKMTSDINAELDLAKVSRDIAEKEEKIEKLKEKSEGASITAPVAGTVTTLAYVAGETTKPDEDAAVIQIEGKGFTLSVSVTNEQAKKVQAGDTAELQNSWYYEDAKIILNAVKPDPDDPGQKKLLVFDVTGGNIQAGQNLSISVGQRSAEYDLVVPNSAVREDNNGKFILIVQSKSSPLGNRYIATRVDVEVIASDDKNTAITAPLNGYEYVITTSTKPVEAGKQVRLNE